MNSIQLLSTEIIVKSNLDPKNLYLNTTEDIIKYKFKSRKKHLKSAENSHLITMENTVINTNIDL